MGLLVLAVLGLVLGVWLGRPGRYDQTADDIEKLMEKGGGVRRRRAKREISPLAWLQRKLSPGRSPPPTRKRGFRLESPEERDRR